MAKSGAIDQEIYQEHGHNNRDEYLEDLADEYGVDVGTVYAASSVLGSSEDFDGLPSMLEDYAYMMVGV